MYDSEAFEPPNLPIVTRSYSIHTTLHNSMLQELESDSLQSIVEGNETVVVQFSATWCGNCKIMKPKFKKLASENESIPFVIADAEKFPASRQLANVDNLPTFATFKNGVLVNQVQTNKFDSLISLVNEVTHN
jgi:thiol-disulfide isomerase/thioredoxin